MFGKQIDFLAIGDITTDAFIRIKDASVNCDLNHEHCKLCVRFGDKVPYESVDVIRAVGNGPNAAVSAVRLGLNTALVTNLGDDKNGRECLEQIAKEGISRKFITTHRGTKTNYHYVLWYEDERTILIKHEEYKYVFPQVKSPRWIYLTSLGEHALDYHDDIAMHLEAHPEIKFAFQPGTFQLRLGIKRLEKLYGHCEVFVCNKEEAAGLLLLDVGDMKKLLSGIRAYGPKIVIITDGPNGAYLYDGTDYLFMSIYPDPKPPLERTGAGDAFASTFVSALALGMSPREALRFAPINSMSVVQQVGAQRGLLTLAKAKEFLAKAPIEYQPKKLD